MSEKKEHPILFSAPMVRATLDGQKTQTRRVVRKQFAPNAAPAEVPATSPEGWQISGHSGLWWDDAGNCFIDEAIRCPYGKPGDLLWGREAWRAPASCDHLPPRSISDSESVRFISDEVTGRDAGFGKGRPGMFMPRWASRILLKVTAVRIERLNDIGPEDCLAEGIEKRSGGRCELTGEYQRLWEAINGPGSWDANPWVWVVEFNRVPA